MKLGRIYNYWPQIIGEEYVEKAMPVALKSKPLKKKGTKDQYDIEVTLHIITDGAHALALSYQKERILGRIEHLFGERIVTDIKFIQNHLPKKALKARPLPLSVDETNELKSMIAGIEDVALRERLEQFGQKLYETGRN